MTTHEINQIGNKGTHQERLVLTVPFRAGDLHEGRPVGNYQWAYGRKSHCVTTVSGNLHRWLGDDTDIRTLMERTSDVSREHIGMKL
jgi:hypothetical protein